MAEPDKAFVNLKILGTGHAKFRETPTAQVPLIVVVATSRESFGTLVAV